MIQVVSKKLEFFTTHILPLVVEAETSYTPERWSFDNPLHGYCVPVSLFIQDHLGGEIVNCQVILENGNAESHYNNMIDGIEIDLTHGQYTMNTVFEMPQIKRKDFQTPRQYLLSQIYTQKRYLAFKGKAEEIMQQLGFFF